MAVVQYGPNWDDVEDVADSIWANGGEFFVDEDDEDDDYDSPSNYYGEYYM